MTKNDLDDTSKRILKVISESNDRELTVPEISERIGVAGPKVHYRLEHKIEELTEKRGTEARPGSTKDATIIGLTADGKDVAKELSLDYPATAKETIDWAQEADTRLSQATEDAEEALSTARDAKRVTEGLKGGLKSMFEDEIDELEKRLRRRAADAVDTKISHYDLPGPTEDSIATDSDIKNIQSEVEAIRDQLVELADQDDLEDLNKQLNEIATKQNELSTQLTQLERRLQTVEERSLRDFLPF